MVYVNSKKFACESCIKGHRSSSCHHTDRPLFEIKKKGRPVSQCTKCRELRQSKKYHSKCNCHPQTDAAITLQSLSTSSRSKTKRFIPIIPALPNGLRDVIGASESSATLPPDSRQRVDSLLNPCKCTSLWKCECRKSDSAVPGHVSRSVDALSTLAHAAALCCDSSPTDLTPYTPKIVGVTLNNRPRSRATASHYSSSIKHRRPGTIHSPTPGPDLAPILSSISSSSPSFMPEFPSMPPISQITSLAGSGCTCGVQCSCPGCVEHRGHQHANPERRDCTEGCGTCIDASISINFPNLPSSVDSHLPQGTSFLDRFFARAAALPLPPANRKKSSYNIDPMDTTTYSDSVSLLGSQSFAFGSVNLPKLECCGGQCNCPAGQCTCGASCAGCCSDVMNRRLSAERISEPQSSTIGDQAPLSSCCTVEV